MSQKNKKERSDEDFRKKYIKILKEGDIASSNVIEQVKTDKIDTIKRKVIAYENHKKKMKDMNKNKPKRTMKVLSEDYQRLHTKYVRKISKKGVANDIKFFYNTKPKLEKEVLRLELIEKKQLAKQDREKEKANKTKN